MLKKINRDYVLCTTLKAQIKHLKNKTHKLH